MAGYFTYNRHTGRYEVVVPAGVKSGQWIAVTRKDGTTDEVHIDQVGQPFTCQTGDLKGQQACTCTLFADKRTHRAKSKRRRKRK